MRHLLSKTESPKQRMYLLNHFLEQFRTVFRQTMFAEFELIVHDKVNKGNPSLLISSPRSTMG